MKYADFDEWMSGRQWLGDKAPKEGFYGRYTEEELSDIRLGFIMGAEDFPLPSLPLDEKTAFLFRWARDVGESLTRKLNEESK